MSILPDRTAKRMKVPFFFFLFFLCFFSAIHFTHIYTLLSIPDSVVRLINYRVPDPDTDPGISRTTSSKAVCVSR